MRASSTAYSAEIAPDSCLRRIVLVSAIALALLGATAIGVATLPAWVRLLALPGWLAMSYLEIRALRYGWERAGRLRFRASGDVEIRGRDGNWGPARLLDGSVLLRRLGWLRLIADDGVRIHELVRGSCRSDRDWRRLHVIWRHV